MKYTDHFCTLSKLLESKNTNCNQQYTQSNGTMCLRFAFAISMAWEQHSALRQVSCSQFHLFCSSCQQQGGKARFVPGELLHFFSGNLSETTPGLLQLLHFSPPIKIRLTLQDPLKCYLKSSLLQPPTLTFYSGQNSLPVLHKHSLLFPMNVPFSHSFFQHISCENLLCARHYSRNWGCGSLQNRQKSSHSFSMGRANILVLLFLHEYFGLVYSIMHSNKYMKKCSTIAMQGNAY